MKIIFHWIILSVAIFLTTKIVSGIYISPVWVALVVGACLTLINMFVKPIVTILTLPINIVTLGLFSLVINGLLFWYLGTVIKGFSVSTFSAAFFGSILVSVISWVFKKIFKIES